MFQIKVRDVEHHIEWHIPSKKPVTLSKLIWFVADGDELELVRSHFTGIPITKGNYCIWHGEIAEFIFNNLSSHV